MSAFQRQHQLLKLVRIVLIVVSTVWTTYAALFALWHRPLSGLVAATAAFACAGALLMSYSRQWSLRRCVHSSLSVSSLSLLLLALLSGQNASPFVWIITSLPVFAFCFLSTREAALWTLASAGIVVSVHTGYLPGRPEFQPSTWEICGYQLLVVFLMTMVSGIVKSLSVRHVEAIQQAKREAELSAEARARFTSHVSHEMRHPLQSIMGALELVDLDRLPVEQREFALQARKDAALLANLVDSTLLFAELSEGNYVVSTQPFTIKEMAHILRFRFEQKFAERGVEFKLESSEAGGLLEGDRAAIEHALAILLDNALKFTGRGDRVEVTIEVEAQALKVVVSDTGAGMSAETMATLCEPFQRGGELAQRKERGWGMGLAVTDKLVQRLGGTWNMKSSPGAGSRCSLSVPVKSLENAACMTPDSLNILVVDDDPVCLKVAQKLLLKLGHQVRALSCSRNVEKAVSDETFDLILMDCQMPEVDGFEATRRVRQAGYSGPVIALTANTAMGDRRRCAESGMTGVVSKPATLAKLMHTIHRYSSGTR